MNDKGHKFTMENKNPLNDTLKNQPTDYIYNNIGGRYN